MYLARSRDEIRSTFRSGHSQFGMVGIRHVPMGSGIAQVAATAGCAVKLYDANPEALKNAEASLEKILNRLIEKKYIGETEKNLIQNNIEYVASLEALSESELVIEAIIEDLEIKKKVF